MKDEAREAQPHPGSRKDFETLRWFVGIPIGTNPLILLDIVSVLFLAWCVMAVLLLCLQFFFGGYLDRTHLKGAAYVAGFVTLIFTGIFVLAAFVIQKNRYAALYRFEENQVYCENLRAFPHALRPFYLMRWRGYEIEPVEKSLRSVVKCVPWSDVGTISSIGKLHVILLQGRRGTLMRVYCPNEEIFTKALLFAECRRKIT